VASGITIAHRDHTTQAGVEPPSPSVSVGVEGDPLRAANPQGHFETDEAEYAKLGQWVEPRDWVLDVGANVGHYSRKLSELVGRNGRVFSFQPVPQTFEILGANMACWPVSNVTLFNVAASDVMGTMGMSIPSFDTGLQNYYMAKRYG